MTGTNNNKKQNETIDRIESDKDTVSVFCGIVKNDRCVAVILPLKWVCALESSLPVRLLVL
jgi:hypothetical protein